MQPPIMASRECYTCTRFMKECDGYMERETVIGCDFCSGYMHDRTREMPAQTQNPTCFLDFLWPENP
jgi:hypothetical protein